MKRVTIYWTCSRATKKKIMQYFGIQDYTSVAGETEANIDDEKWSTFKETEERGFFVVRNK